MAKYESTEVPPLISKRMSAIKGSNTSIEVKLRKLLWKDGLRYRLKNKLNGKPDLIFPIQKIAIFVDGDFWHGYDWNKLRPKLKNDFWINKILQNMDRDKKIDLILTQKGWKVMRFWEHEINLDIFSVISRIRSAIHNK